MSDCPLLLFVFCHPIDPRVHCGPRWPLRESRVLTSSHLHRVHHLNQFKSQAYCSSFHIDHFLNSLFFLLWGNFSWIRSCCDSRKGHPWWYLFCAFFFLLETIRSILTDDGRSASKLVWFCGRHSDCVQLLTSSTTSQGFNQPTKGLRDEGCYYFFRILKISNNKTQERSYI